MPFQFRTYFLTLYRSLSIEAPWSGTRILILFFFVFLYPPAQLFNALTLLLDHIFFPGFKKIQVKNPVFIMGNARSGTTYMHRLMAMDTERFETLKFSDLIFISVGAKKFFMAIGRLDRALGGHLNRGIEALQNRLLKNADRIHKLRLNHPEEDEGVLFHCWATAFLALAFPISIMQQWERFDELPDAKRKSLMGFYKACVQRHLYCHGGDAKQHLSKNPLFATKIRSIFETFPDARLVYMARTPYETVASIHNMVDRIWNIQLKLSPTAQPREGLTQLCIYAYRYALTELDRHDQAASIIVKYEDLVKDPLGSVNAIYDKFHYEMSPRYRAALEALAAKNKGYKSEHQYSLEQFGLSQERIYQETQDVFDRFGFDRGGEFASDAALASSQARVE